MKSLKELIVDYLKEHGEGTTVQMVKELGHERNDIITECLNLVKEGKLAKTPVGDGPALFRIIQRKPFSVTGLTGFHAKDGNVILFLDRRLSARSIKLPAERLKQLADLALGS